MIVTLTNDEVRAALARAIEEKTSYVLGTVTADDCWFDVKSEGEEIEVVSSIEFSFEFAAEKE